MAAAPPRRALTRSQSKLADVLNDDTQLRKRATEYFNEADVDCSGALDHEEVFRLLAKIIDRANREGHDGGAFNTPTREKVQVMLDKHDRNGDGELELEEFISLFKVVVGSALKKRLEAKEKKREAAAAASKLAHAEAKEAEAAAKTKVEAAAKAKAEAEAAAAEAEEKAQLETEKNAKAEAEAEAEAEAFATFAAEAAATRAKAEAEATAKAEAKARAEAEEKARAEAEADAWAEAALAAEKAEADKMQAEVGSEQQRADEAAASPGLAGRLWSGVTGTGSYVWGAGSYVKDKVLGRREEEPQDAQGAEADGTPAPVTPKPKASAAPAIAAAATPKPAKSPAAPAPQRSPASFLKFVGEERGDDGAPPPPPGVRGSTREECSANIARQIAEQQKAAQEAADEAARVAADEEAAREAKRQQKLAAAEAREKAFKSIVSGARGVASTLAAIPMRPRRKTAAAPASTEVGKASSYEEDEGPGQEEFVDPPLAEDGGVASKAPATAADAPAVAESDGMVFISSPFATKVEFETWQRIDDPAERDAAVAAAWKDQLARRKRAAAPPWRRATMALAAKMGDGTKQLASKVGDSTKQLAANTAELTTKWHEVIAEVTAKPPVVRSLKELSEGQRNDSLRQIAPLPKVTRELTIKELKELNGDGPRSKAAPVPAAKAAAAADSGVQEKKEQAPPTPPARAATSIPRSDSHKENSFPSPD